MNTYKLHSTNRNDSAYEYSTMYEIGQRPVARALLHLLRLLRLCRFMDRNCSLKPRLWRFADWWNSSTIHHSQSRFCSMLYYQRSDRAPINDQTRTHALLSTCMHPGQPRLEISHNLIISQDSFTLGHMNHMHQHCGIECLERNQINEWGEPTASYRWTGWVCDTVRTL